ncbi:MAG TPA: hypothetical protein VF676_13230 [Flavobacterium sp.]|jgi:hypothetical protein
MTAAQTYRPLAEITLYSVAALLLHKLAFYFLGFSDDGFKYPVLKLYAIFIFASASIIFFLIRISKVSFDNVGFAFMILTMLKLGLAYALLKRIGARTGADVQFETTNFFLVVMLFLVLETLCSVKLLKKQ